MLELLLVHSQDDLHDATHAWGIFGPKGLPRLDEILKTSTESAPAVLAINHLGQAQYLPALPDIRAAIAREETPVRQAAIRALGQFGHPDDYQTLVRGLSGPEPDDLATYVSALAAFGDVRAVPQLLPLLRHEDSSVRRAVIAALGGYLVTPAGLQALHDYATQTSDKNEKASCERYVTSALYISGLLWDAFAGSAAAEQEKVAAAARNADYTLMEGERALTRAEFLDMVGLWTELGRKYIFDASEGNVDYNDAELRHILPAATAGDIDLLLGARATFYARFSDESDYDIGDVNALVRELGRTRYRAAAAQPTPQAPAAPAEHSVSPVSQTRARDLMEAAVNAVEGVSSTLLSSAFSKGELPTLGYTTSLSATGVPEPFMKQLRQVVFAAVPGFVRANPAWDALKFSPLASGGYGTVTVARQPALDWYTGKLDDAAFEKTWKIEGFGR
jgi:hypothetical protein